MVEADSDASLHNADTQDVAFLVVGDPSGYVSLLPVGLSGHTRDSATTHIDIVLCARAKHIPVRIIHNASIMNAIGASGLQLYTFGQAISLVLFTDAWKPNLFYARIKENSDLRLHTLVLLDIKVKELSKNLAKFVSRTMLSLGY